MNNTIEASVDEYTGVADVDSCYNICEVNWWLMDEEGSEFQVRVWNVPRDIQLKIIHKLAEEAYRQSVDSQQPDPMDLSHAHKEDL
jgi:hypothetical protein